MALDCSELNKMLKDEIGAAATYKYYAEMAPDKETKKIWNKMSRDELKHAVEIIMMSQKIECSMPSIRKKAHKLTETDILFGE